MDERDLSAVFARAERAENAANMAVGMLARQAEHMAALEARIRALETPPYAPPVTVEESAP